MCTYPRLIAACRVLHRLSEPRHPPSALHYFLSESRRTSIKVYISTYALKKPLALILSAVLWIFIGTFIKNVPLVYSLACVNMSKIFWSEEWREKSEELIFHFSFFTFLLLEWRITDSNRWPPACKAGALASWANPPNIYYLIVIIFYLKDITFKY